MILLSSNLLFRICHKNTIESVSMRYTDSSIGGESYRVNGERERVLHLLFIPLRNNPQT